MAPVDGMLKLFVDQGGDELQLAAGAQPKMFQRGSPMKLSLPLTPDSMLRHLLGDLLTDDREAELRQRGVSEFDYAPQGSSARFHVSLKPGAAGLAATFRVGGRSATPATPRMA